MNAEKGSAKKSPAKNAGAGVVDKKVKATNAASSKKSTSRKEAQDRKDRARDLVRATLKHVRISPRKLRLVVEMIRGKQVEPAIQILRFSPKKGSAITLKVLQSAISNAKETKGADVDKLWVTGGWVSMGRTIKRYMPGAQGRATPIKKRSAHLTIMLGEK